MDFLQLGLVITVDYKFPFYTITIFTAMVHYKLHIIQNYYDHLTIVIKYKLTKVLHNTYKSTS